MSAEAAAAKPVPHGHSIWELVLHIQAWMQAAHRRLHGDPAELSQQEDWPAVPEPNETEWKRAVASLEAAHNRLRDAVAGLPDSALDAITPGKRHSQEFLLHGVIQHNLYHAGQIALLKKALAIA